MGKTSRYIQNKKRSSLMALFLMICMIASIISLKPVHAETGPGSITFTNSWVTAGHTFYLYKIANLSDNHLIAEDSYKNVIDVNHSTADADYWRNSVSSVEKVINDQKIGPFASTTSSSQKVVFINLPLGLYLVTSDSFQTQVGSQYYTAAPTFVSVPKNTADLAYNVTAEIKPITSPVPEQPVKPTPSKSGGKTPRKDNENGKGEKNPNENNKIRNDISSGKDDHGNHGIDKTNTHNQYGTENDKKNSKKEKTANENPSSNNQNHFITSVNKSIHHVKTGDATKIGTYIILLLLSAGILIFAIYKLRGKD